MSLGLANPAGAVALIAVGVLVALWLHDRRRRVIPVGTLFLWKQVPPSDLERRRFRPDLLFVLQLALLLALIAGFLRPYVEGGERSAVPARLCLVVDVSASMQAREDGSTRLEIARRRADALVAALGSGEEVMLVAAAERAHVVLRWTTDHPRVRERLAALEPLDTPTNLAPALGLALAEARARPSTRVAVLSDLPPEASGVARDALTSVDWVQVGRSDDNVAIASLLVAEPPFGGTRDATATVVVRNYAHAARRAALVATVDGESWARRDLALAARASAQVVLAAPPRPGPLVVTLLADDALAVDNRAVGWIGAPAPLDLLLVTESRELGADFDALAAAIPGSRVEVVNRARYAEAPPVGHRVALFDAFVPAKGPPGAALYVAPPPGNPICPSAEAIERAVVIDWDDAHPALAGLRALESFDAVWAHPLAVPSWAVPIVFAGTRQGAFPLLLAGEHAGRRVACLGAELVTPLASSDRLPLLVLALGALRWLAEPLAATALAVETGVPVVAAGASGAVDRPGLRIAGDPAVLLAERVGSYRVGERVVLANLFDERESDIGRDGDREWPASTPAAVAPIGGTNHEFGWWLYLTGAALLGIEWLAWLGRERA